MQLRENARPITEEERQQWLDGKWEAWALGEDGRPDSSPGLIGWGMLAVGCSLIAFAAGIFWVLS